jgi:Zn-dependent protease with chaperone function
MIEVQGIQLGFQEYIDRRRAGGKFAEAEDYGYAGDQKLLRTLRKITPVQLALEKAVSLFNSVARNQLLGNAVLVTPKQFSHLYDLGQRCSEILGVPMQPIYVIQGLGSINAGSVGTDEEALVMINSATVDHMTEAELLYVIGHEFGHFQNNHSVPYTALQFLKQMSEQFYGWILMPAALALTQWSRRAEVTADRAGLLCCQDLDVAQRAMAKLALGSKELYEKLDLEEYLKQLVESQGQMSRVVELLQDHPYITKRIEALRLFAESAYYRERLGLEGGMDKATLDDKVSQIIKVL